MIDFLVTAGFWRILGAVTLVQIAGIGLFYIVGSSNARRSYQ
jgi:hypothetical protein